MQALKTSLVFETAFGVYTATHLIGQGGAGKVYAAEDDDHEAVAIKALDKLAPKDKRKRFKNEIAFLARQRHKHLVPVLDHGFQSEIGPFYVMPRYAGSLRDLMQESGRREDALSLFMQILEGVEAAHLLEAVHRDLKPENILFNERNELAIADFGVAQFAADMQATLVETSKGTRLANFAYAAPEQRRVGAPVGRAADIFALGLILNELFTAEIPQGAGYRTIAQVAPSFGYLDQVVEALIQQTPNLRPATIAEVKRLLSLGRGAAISNQRLSEISQTVVHEGEIDDPLALEPLRVVDADWRESTLTLVLSRPVHDKWINALQNMGNHSAVWGKGPGAFSFDRDRAVVSAGPSEVQQIIDHFKDWLEPARRTLAAMYETEFARKAQLDAQRLHQEAEKIAERQRVKDSMRI